MSNLIRYLRYDWPVHFILLLTNWLPDNVIFLRFRGWLVRPFVGRCGKDLRLGRSINIYNPSNIRMGNNIYIANGCQLLANDVITLEDQVMFGPCVVAVSDNHTRLNGSYRYGACANAPIRIGRGAWIGAQAVITAGSNIGAGALVAAGAVVTGEVVANVIVGGVPARQIRVVEE